jgi:hypothetical protein
MIQVIIRYSGFPEIVVNYNQLLLMFYSAGVLILFVLTIFIMYKDFIKRTNELNRIDKIFFQKVKE